VKAYSLRAAHVGATLTALLVAVTVEPAAAHVDVRPDLVEQGAVTEIRVELPRIVPGPDLVRLEIEGDGIEVLSTRKLDVQGPDSYWSARVRVDAPVGSAPFVLRPFYADGDSVEFRQAFTVVPGEEEESFPWLVVVVGVAAALALSAALLAVARRRTA
jgi:hypothetical protein